MPLTTVSAPAHARDHTLLAPTPDALTDWQPPPAHLDAGYDYQPCQMEVAKPGLLAQISRRDVPAPIQIGRRWMVERTHFGLNNLGKIRRCTERRQVCLDAHPALAAALVTVRALLRGVWYSYR